MKTDDREFFRELGIFTALLCSVINGSVLAIGWILTNGEKITSFLLH